MAEHSIVVRSPTLTLRCTQRCVCKILCSCLTISAVAGRLLTPISSQMQLANVLSWFIANVYVVAAPCRWFDSFVIVNGALCSQPGCKRLRPLSDMHTCIIRCYMLDSFATSIGDSLTYMRTGTIQWSLW